jgi:hypothetical protein
MTSSSTQDGRLCSAWNEYLSNTLKPGAPQEQVNALRRSFFAGMQALLMGLQPESIREVEYHDWELLQEFRREFYACHPE